MIHSNGLTLDDLRSRHLDLPDLVHLAQTLRRHAHWDAADLVEAEIDLRLTLQSVWARHLPTAQDYYGWAR